MTKKEIFKLTKEVKRLTMADVKLISHKKDWCEGYKNGFNFCRRKVRKILGLLK